MRLGRGDHYVPAEDQRPQDLSPAEALLAAANPDFAPRAILSGAGEDGVVHRPWSPTGDEQPKKTIVAADDLEFSPPPPETAGGAIPSAFARFRQYGPDES